MAAVIDIKNLTVNSGRKILLDIERLCVNGSEFVGLLGPNGAGKTTMLKCCMGFSRHAAGSVDVLGMDVMAISSARRNVLRRRIAYVPQLLTPPSEMPLTVREVISTGRAGIAGLFRRLNGDDLQIVEKWIHALGLGEIAGRGYGEISGGEQRKTLIARAMVQQPQILLLDEPTANLDLQWREKIVSLLAELYAAENLTVVMVCHELEALPPCCGRVVLLDCGRVAVDGAPEEIFTQERIRKFYGSGLEFVRRGGRYALIPQGVCDA